MTRAPTYLTFKNDPYPAITAMTRERLFPGRAGRVDRLDEISWNRGVQPAWTLGDVLYLVQDSGSGPSKIGITTHPWRRFESLQCGNPRPLVMRAIYRGRRHHCAATEIAVLQYFGKLRVREWIHTPYERVIEFIEDCRATAEAQK